jgi:hypothetical protein
MPRKKISELSPAEAKARRDKDALAKALWRVGREPEKDNRGYRKRPDAAARMRKHRAKKKQQSEGDCNE